MGHERRLTLGLIAGMARTLLDRRALEKLLIDPVNTHSLDMGTHSPSSYLPSTNTATTTQFDQSSVDLVVDQVYYGPFCCPPVFYTNRSTAAGEPHQYYAIYTYEYGGSAPSSPPCCDVTTTSSSCCPYCETCPQCNAESSEL